MEKINEIIEQLKKRYQDDNNVIGMMIFGSFARNTYDKYSDLDVYILIKKRGRFSREGRILDGIEVDIIYDTIKESENFLRQEKNSVKRNTSHMLAYGKIIFDTDNKLKKLQNQARKNLKSDTKYLRGEVLMHLYSLNDFYNEVKRFYDEKDSFSFEQNAQLYKDNLMELYLKMNNQYLRRPNEMYDVLKKIDPQVSKYLKNYSEQKTMSGKMKIIDKLNKKVLSIRNEYIHGPWFVK